MPVLPRVALFALYSAETLAATSRNAATTLVLARHFGRNLYDQPPGLRRPTAAATRFGATSRPLWMLGLYGTLNAPVEYAFSP
uniref:Putative secreted protein n=1 Tax=Ixodes ricinus TaxID=34613 RepID=A0A6B0U7K6_IXORI